MKDRAGMAHNFPETPLLLLDGAIENGLCNESLEPCRVGRRGIAVLHPLHEVLEVLLSTEADAVGQAVCSANFSASSAAGEEAGSFFWQ